MHKKARTADCMQKMETRDTAIKNAYKHKHTHEFKASPVTGQQSLAQHADVKCVTKLHIANHAWQFLRESNGIARRQWHC